MVLSWSEATKKGSRGIPLQDAILRQQNRESCLNNPSVEKAVKINCDCECDGGIKFNYEGMDCCSVRNVLDYMLAL